VTAKRNYAPLDASELVDPQYLGTGTPDGTKFLRDDQTYATPSGSGNVATDAIWDAAGDLAVGTGANTAAKLAKGSDGQVLTVDPTTHLLVWATPTGGGAPTTADYLVGTADAGLSNEIVVGTSPGGELGGTWASPTVDATHSGSAHHAESHASRHAAAGADAVKLDDLAAPDDNTDLNVSSSAHGLMSKLPGGGTNFFREDGTWAAPSGSGAPASVDYLVGTADAGLSSEIVVGTSPGGELGGTWASPTVDATHSGSAHHTQSHDHSAAGDGTTLTPAHLNVPVEAPGTTEGRIGWDGTVRQASVYDSVRDRPVTPTGYQAFAFSGTTNDWAGAPAGSNLGAVSGGNGGAYLYPIRLDAPMLLQQLWFWNTNTATARSAEWRLFYERLGNSATLDEVANANGTWSFTPSAASWRSSAAQSPPVLLGPGVYWVVIRNTSTSQTLGVGIGTAGGTGSPSTGRTASIAALGSTLNSASFTGTTTSAVYFALHGRVFNEGAAY